MRLEGNGKGKRKESDFREICIQNRSLASAQDTKESSSST